MAVYVFILSWVRMIRDFFLKLSMCTSSSLKN